MAALFGRRPSYRPAPEELPEVLKELLQEVRAEKAELEVLLHKVALSGKNLGAVTDQIADVQARQRELGERFDGVEHLAEKIQHADGDVEAVRRRTLELMGTMTDKEGELSSLADEVKEITGALIGIRDSVQRGQRLKADLESLSSPDGTVATLTSAVEQLRTRLQNLGDEVQEVAEAQRGLGDAQSEEIAKIREVGASATDLVRDVEASAERLARMESTLGKLSHVGEVAIRLEQQLQGLNSLAEHVGQKTVMLERQREVVDRAAAQASRLDTQIWDFENKIKKIEAEGQAIKKSQLALVEAEELAAKMEERLERLQATKTYTDRNADALEQRFKALLDETGTALGEMEQNHGRLSTANQQIAEIRKTLVDFEARQGAVEQSTRALVEAQAQVDDLSARLTTVGGDVGRVEEKSERVLALDSLLERAQARATDVEARLDAAERAGQVLTRVEAQVEALQAAGEAAEASQEQLRANRMEMERSRVAQLEMQKVLAATEARMDDARESFAELDRLSQEMTAIRQRMELVAASAETVEDRVEFVTAMERRLTDLKAMWDALDGRRSDLEEARAEFGVLEDRISGLTRLAGDLDQRIGRINERSGEVLSVGERIDALAGKVDGAEERMAQVEADAEGVLLRAEKANELERHLEALREEVTQQSVSVRGAAEELKRADALRLEVSGSIRELERQQQQLAEGLENAGDRASEVSEMANRVDARMGGLRFAEKRMTQFEEKLALLERDERNLESSIRDVAERQQSVDAVRQELTELFATAERTLASIQQITASQGQIEDTRSLLHEVLSGSGRLEKLSATVERRRIEITEAEERLARLDTLFHDMGGSLETLKTQKAMVDLVLQKAGHLSFQAREAESLLVALKEEREIATQVKDSLEEFRDGGQLAG
ncbi:MAG TPA: hypothetical protein VJ997_04535 [Longimicrobiales bacterium]|nr:hypothetical protein [Longimicrobiales bacterium]